MQKSFTQRIRERKDMREYCRDCEHVDYSTMYASDPPFYKVDGSPLYKVDYYGPPLYKCEYYGCLVSPDDRCRVTQNDLCQEGTDACLK